MRRWFAILVLLWPVVAYGNFAIFQVAGTSGACWTTGIDGWTVICSTPVTSGTCAIAGARDANGTCWVAVANSGSSSCDAYTTQAAAIAAPCDTPANAYLKIRNNSDDHLIFNKGDTWTDQEIWMKWSGISSSRPILIGVYGTGARPVIKCNPSLGDSGCVFSTAAGGGIVGGNNIAVIGLKLTNYTRDPANIGTTFDATNGAFSGIAPLNAYTWFMVEDCYVSFFTNNLTFDALVTPAVQFPHTNTYIRRNILVDAWSATGHSQNIHATYNYGTLLLEENLFDRGGWNETLLAQITATTTIATPGVVTATFGYTLYNGAGMTFHNNGDTLPTGYAFNTCYFIVNYGVDGANKFRLSLTVGGADINTTGSQAGTHKIAWDCPDASPQASIFNHNVYLDSANAMATIHGNINTNASNTAYQGRPGGTWSNDLVSANPSAGFMAASGSSVHDNVFIAGAGHICNVSCPTQSDGPQLIAASNGTMTNNLIAKAATGISGGTAIGLSDSHDDCGDGSGGHGILFSIANPTVVTLYANAVVDGLVIAATTNTGSSSCTGGTLPAAIVQDANLFVRNSTVPVSGSPGTFNVSSTANGALISTAGNTQSGVFGSRYYSYGNSATGNTIYDWGDATANANISNAAANPGSNTITPNTNFNAGGGSFPDTTRSIGTYNAQITGCGALPGGCTATLAAFLTNARAQSKDNWRTDLTACAVNTWIGAGFSMTFSGTCN